VWRWTVPEIHQDAAIGETMQGRPKQQYRATIALDCLLKPMKSSRWQATNKSGLCLLCFVLQPGMGSHRGQFSPRLPPIKLVAALF